MEIVTMKDAAKAMAEAIKDGDEGRVETAWMSVCKAASENARKQLEEDYDEYRRTEDVKILERRGIRVLTSTEEKFYNAVIGAMKSTNPKQEFIDVLTSSEDAMPETIIEDVLRGITQQHPLLSKIDVQSVGYLTKWILNTHSYQAAAWGAITAEIEKEITSSIEVIDLKQNKLSCFAILELGMLDLGPAWLDSYVRAALTEAMSYALELAVVSGNGSSCPIGMDRDLDSETSGAYSQKTAVAVTSFSPEEYGPLVAKIAVDKNGKPRSIAGLCMIANQTTYLSKIMPATTLLNNAGQYVRSAYPIATEDVTCNALKDNYALLGVPSNYFLAVGKSARNNTIQYSDEYKFLEDQRVFKVVRFSDGRPVDNYAFLLLDLSNLEPASIYVTSSSSSTTSE